MGTIFTSLVLTVIVAAIIMKIRRDRKRNRCTSCSCCNTGICGGLNSESGGNARIDNNNK
ncbi:MAG: hypothetical protein FWC03_12605 [Treponema sp.]|nr:hypothetical protein [Treponema sp.]